MNKQKIKRTTISIPEELRLRLEKLKIHPNQAYTEIIEQLLNEVKK